MPYMVQGADGKEYGPATLETLQKWVTENRLAPDTLLRDTQTDHVLPAKMVQGLFGNPATVDGPTPPVVLPRQAPQNPYAANDPFAPQQPMQPQIPPEPGKWAVPPGTRQVNYAPDDTKGLWSVIMWGAICLALFFFVRTLGIISVSVAMGAWREQKRGSKYGPLCMVIAGVVILCVIGGWILRASNSTGF